MKILIVTLFLLNSLFASYSELLFNGNCVTCHKVDKSISAPSIKVIQKRYKDAFTKKEDFVEYMSSWVLKPDSKKSLMQDAIIKYELMPELGYQKDVLKQIALYIYETNFNKKK